MLALLVSFSALPQDQPPPAPREFRAAWVATVANIDWPSKPGLTTAQQKAEILAIMDKSRAMNLNALVWQIRPATDALYDSKLEPWSEYLTGTQGQAPEPYYDPLEFIVDEAHKRGIELHCWFNPYRAKHSAAKSPLSPDHISKRRPGIVKQYGDFLWMDPGEKATQEHSLSVMMDVVKRYDVDGVHIDDYFYPYKSYAKNADFPDEPSWRAYQASGGKLDRGDWRRKNVDDFVERLYKSIKQEKPWVKFGISPFGIYRPGYPADVKTSFDQYDQLYADARRWLVEGWCDYYSPQLYWQINSPQPYVSLLNWWSAHNPKKRHLWPGLFTGKVSEKEGNWPTAEIVNQVLATRRSNGRSTGNVHFSMRAFTQKWKNLDDTLRTGVYAKPALVPASPWLDKERPKQPKVRTVKDGALTNYIFDAAQPKDVWVWAYYVKTQGKWSLAEVIPGHITSKRLNAAAQRKTGTTAIAVAAVDRCGNESAPYLVRF
jgi:uncharacterized lipoprotein YddW (UPF0748 family)